jgi:predicted 3-demethylubiquinone-9 3-methyltransferase (glyoxalase superfamily)
MQKIVTSLWMADWIEEACNFYVSLFENSRITDVSRYGDAMPGMEGKVLAISFELAGQQYMAINGGTQFPFTEAISLYVNCEGQAEVDRLWNALTANGGTESQCGWLKDKYGLSWQIIPTALPRFVGGPDKAGANRAMQAMLQMKKIDAAALERAYNGAA